jgi:alpha-N-acetylglucosamine transferase
MLPHISSSKSITRQEFLDITTKYLVFNDNNYSDINYRDLDAESNKKASKVFDLNNTWKDQFGQNYFRPNEKITR